MDYSCKGHVVAPAVCEACWPAVTVFVATLVVTTITCLCVALASRFYRFLARFSGRRRSPQAARAGLMRPTVSSLPFSTMPPSLTTLVLLVSTLLGIAEACSSRSTPKPRPPSPTARPNITFQTYECPPAYAKWYCLNNATCFTVKIGESLLYNCECADGFMGQRCEFKDLDGSYLPSRQRVMLETASIAGGATIAVFLVVIVCMVVYIRLQQRPKKERGGLVTSTAGNSQTLRPFSRSLVISMPTIRECTTPAFEPVLSPDRSEEDLPTFQAGAIEKEHPAKSMFLRNPPESTFKYLFSCPTTREPSATSLPSWKETVSQTSVMSSDSATQGPSTSGQGRNFSETEVCANIFSETELSTSSYVSD